MVLAIRLAPEMDNTQGDSGKSGKFEKDARGMVHVGVHDRIPLPSQQGHKSPWKASLAKGKVVNATAQLAGFVVQDPRLAREDAVVNLDPLSPFRVTLDVTGDIQSPFFCTAAIQARKQMQDPHRRSVKSVCFAHEKPLLMMTGPAKGRGKT